MKNFLVLMVVALLGMACAKQGPEGNVSESDGSRATQDAIVLVHGNAGSTSNWSRTVNRLKSNGITKIYNVSWGTWNASNNDHNSTNVGKVKTAMINAKNASPTGKIDVIGHSMGVTLAAEAIRQLGYQGKVATFVGIAGAIRGLNSCGVYPYNVATKTCGSKGLSVKSPFLTTLQNSLNSKKLASRLYSIKSYYDQLVCAPAAPTYCYVYGTHSSMIPKQNSSYTYNGYGHFNLQKYTDSKQVSLVKN